MGEIMGSGGVIAQTIQLALAPVFVLVAIGNIMNILSQRLGRVVDRSRVLQQLHGTTSGDAHDAVVREIRTVDRRIAMISRAILLLVLSGLTIGLCASRCCSSRNCSMWTCSRPPPRPSCWRSPC